MRTSRIIIGSLLLTLLPLGGVAATVKATTLYERMRQSVESDNDREMIDPAVEKFIQSIMIKDGDDTITTDDVEAAILGQIDTYCGTREGEDPVKQRDQCMTNVTRIQQMATYESRVRRLGRDLQIQASSYELPISDLPGRSLKLTADMRGIVNIWGTDNVSFSGSLVTATPTTASGSNPWPIRTKTVDSDVMRPLLQDIGDALTALKDDERVGAVWRYQYGVRLVQDKRAPDYPTPIDSGKNSRNTERRYLFAHWKTLEEKLSALWEAIRNDTFSPPLQKNESALYVFPKDLLRETLPDNVIVWARVDGDPRHPLGDTGLQWEVPMEPVLPTLLTDTNDAILGGNYPPDPMIMSGGTLVPLDGQGLCTSPTALRGYLCRPFTQASGKRCPQDKDVDPDTINLTSCTDTGSIRSTIAGSDVCRDLLYKERADFDPNTQCTLNIHCESVCKKTGGVTSDVSALTSLKTADGTVDVCISNFADDIPANYLLYHELHHAYQICNQKPGFNPEKTGDPERDAAACCALEGEAYRAQADLMERDGIFKDIAPIDGIPMNAETYAEAWTDFSCGPRDGFKGCHVSRVYTSDFKKALANLNKDVIRGDACPIVIDPKKIDPRIKDFKRTIEMRADICRPGQVDVYKNRIGNNMCYIGQCVEESSELHRMTGAQSPATVQDEGYPWNDPETGSPLGTALVNPPLTPGFLPLFRPQLIVHTMEEELCQLVGLPTRSPPILCAIESARRLNQPLADQAENIQNLLIQSNEQQNASVNLLRLSQAVGSTIGTGMYSSALHGMSTSLADVLTMAVKLFTEMSSLHFPTEMCPLDNALPPRADTTP